MVQRKVPSKLSIQADHVISSQKLLGSLRPSSPRYHDGKNRGADLKKMRKMMKKSRSIKSSDFGSPQSPSFIRNIPQPGRPPPLADDFPAITPIPQKQMSPNYMRSTSSFDAKKESQQVSSRNSPSSVNKDKDTRKRSTSTKLGSGSGHKPTSSLKLVRTLTKTTSFKPPRASSTRKKCSQVILCEEGLDVQRATCSSSLKDSNFPAYLELNPGGTELVGTSVLKVCPYTYCSLNGHHHTPLSPLKCFLSAQRRMLKTQKSIKLACLSPRRSKSSFNGVKETEMLQIAINKKPTNQVIEGHMDFFIEISTKKVESASDTTGRSKQNGGDQDSIYFAINDFAPSAADQVDGQDVENLSDEVPQSGIDFDDNFNKNSDPHMMKTGFIDPFATEDRSVDVAEEIHLPFLAQQEEISEFHGNDRDLEEASLASNEDATDSEASDMDGQEGPSEIPYLCEEVDNLAQNSNESDAEVGPSFENVANSHGEDIFMPDDIVRSYFDEIPADEILEEFSGVDDQISSVADSGDDFSESLASYQSPGNEAFIEESDSQSHSQIHLTSEMFVDTNAEGNAMAHDLPTIATSLPLEDNKTEPTSSSKDEVLIHPYSDECLHDFDARSLSNYIVEGQNQKQKDHDNAVCIKITDFISSADEAHPELKKVSASENGEQDVNEMELDSSPILDAEASFTSAKNIVHTQTRTRFLRQERNPIQKQPKNHYNLKIIRSKISAEELEESRKFNPKEPNYLPVEPDPEAEKVDLRHQMMDERKNSEEWMLDHALQRAVTKLAPARKRKVALLVEAFETVTPIPKYKPHLRHSSAAFAHARPIQACS